MIFAIQPHPPSIRRMRPAINDSSSPGTPATAMVLSRLVAPLTTASRDLGTPKNLASVASAAALGSQEARAVIDHAIADELQDHDDDDGRDIEAAQIGQEPADGGEHRLGQPEERVVDLADDVVVAVDDRKRDE